MNRNMTLPGQKPGESLDQFHDRCIIPGQDEQTSKKEAINLLARFLHGKKILDCYSVAEVIKVGSLKKGTAVRGQSDVKLVIYLNGFQSMNDFKAERNAILDDLKCKVREYRGEVPVTWFLISDVAVQCQFHGEDIDILPAINVFNFHRGLGPAYDVIASAGDFKAVEGEAQKYSASLTTYQIKFVSCQTETVKRVIRLVKKWKEDKNLTQCISSYTLELVTIYAARKNVPTSTTQLFEAVMNLLKKAGDLKIAFDDNYDSTKYTWRINCPYVLDPANPFKNTLWVSNVLNISEAAKKTLEVESMTLTEQTQGESLDKFHDRCINLLPDEKKSKKEAVNQFARFLHELKFLDCHSVAEVVKGGSLKKGTAVRGQSDIDLVVYLNGFTGMDDFKAKRDDILKDLKCKASHYYGNVLEFEKKTPYSLHYKFNGQDMDILPAVNVMSFFRGLGPTYEAIAKAHDVKEEAKNYSTFFTTFQTRFVSRQTETVKRVIRLVKFWKVEKQVPISSEAVELVTIHAARLRGNVPTSTTQLLEAVMNLLKNAEDLKVIFDEYYDSHLYTELFRVPYVLDPANPFENTLGDSESVKQVSRAAEEILGDSSQW